MSKKFVCLIDFDNRYMQLIMDELKPEFEIVLDQNHGHDSLGVLNDREVEFIVINSDQSVEKLKSLIQSMGLLNKNVPLVVCSSVLRTNDAVDLIRMGVRDVIETPFDAGFLSRRIQNIQHLELGDLARQGIEDDTVLTIQLYERIAIEKALKFCKGNRRAAANMIGVGEATLYRKIKDYNIIAK